MIEPGTGDIGAVAHGVLGGLLPGFVETDCTDAVGSEDCLFPEERAWLAGAVPARRAEFAAVRCCARRALSRLGYPPTPIIPGPHRAPRWPAGVVGSMTHCTGFRAAAVVRAVDLLSIGIDAELNAALPPQVADLVTTADERAALRALTTAHPQVAWDRLLFSAKESIFKVWYPLTGSWLDFDQCELTVGAGTFAGHLHVAGPPVGGRALTRIAGRWTVSGQHLLTAATVDMS